MSNGQLSGINFLLFWSFWFCKTFPLASANGQADVCRMIEFIPLLDGHALVNHVIRNISLERQDACRLACYLDNDCLSYNFGRLQDGTSICQLSDSDHIQHPDDLKKSSGFIYRGTENACSKNLCSTHGKCKIDPKDNTYFCKCEDGFVGKYCEEECSEPLGMEHKDMIPDDQITASTEYDTNHGPSNGRLNFKPGERKTGAWSAGPNDDKQWLQVDLGQRTNVTGIETQGREDYSQWVTSYTVSYSDRGITFTPYKQNVVLQGNSDRNTVVLNVLSPPIKARYIRVHPKTWHGHISMRMELLGCPSVGNAFLFPQKGVSDYVIVNPGMPSLSALTACFWMKSTDTRNHGTPLSYAVRHRHNEFLVINYNAFCLFVGGNVRVTNISANDGQWHHICATWENTYGSWKLYKDGVAAAQGQGLKRRHVIRGAGALVLGQDQDSVAGGFVAYQSFVGEMAGVNIWSRVLGTFEIAAMAQSSCTAGEGNVFKWSNFISSRRGKVQLIHAACNS